MEMNQSNLEGSFYKKIRRGVMCYSCSVEAHTASQCPTRRQGGRSQSVYQEQVSQYGYAYGVTLPRTQVPIVPSNLCNRNSMSNLSGYCEALSFEEVDIAYEDTNIE